MEPSRFFTQELSWTLKDFNSPHFLCSLPMAGRSSVIWPHSFRIAIIIRVSPLPNCYLSYAMTVTDLSNPNAIEIQITSVLFPTFRVIHVLLKFIHWIKLEGWFLWAITHYSISQGPRRKCMGANYWNCGFEESLIKGFSTTVWSGFRKTNEGWSYILALA